MNFNFFFMNFFEKILKKKINLSKPYMDYHLFFVKIFVWPLLLGAPLVNLRSIDKGDPIRVGHEKKITLFASTIWLKMFLQLFELQYVKKMVL